MEADSMPGRMAAAGPVLAWMGLASPVRAVKAATSAAENVLVSENTDPTARPMPSGLVVELLHAADSTPGSVRAARVGVIHLRRGSDLGNICAGDR